MVLDPLADNWGPNSRIYHKMEEFLPVAQEEHNLLLVIDESALTIDRYDDEQKWLAKTSRHNGHASIFIGQNLVDIPKGMRTQARQFFVFRVSRSEAKDLADEFDNDELLKASKLPDFYFYQINGTMVRMGKVDRANGKILAAT